MTTLKKRLKDAHPNWSSATVIYREIVAMVDKGKRSILRHYMRIQELQIEAGKAIRFETEPGKQIQVDWDEFRKVKDRLSAFIATLGFSRVSYVEFVTNQKLSTLLKCHENGFDYFGVVT